MAVLTAYATADFVVQYIAPAESILKATHISRGALKFLEVDSHILFTLSWQCLSSHYEAQDNNGLQTVLCRP